MRHPLARLLLVLGLVCGGVLVVVGGLALRAPGLVAVAATGVLVGCITAGVVRDTPAPDRRPALETAVQVAAGSIAALLAVAGLAVVAGGVVTALVVLATASGAIAVHLLRSRRGTGGVGGGASASRGGHPSLHPLPGPAASRSTGSRFEPLAGSARLLPPVAALSTPDLGQEWLRTTAALSGHLAPAARESIVTRREQVLDELERRDPDGFARWLAAGSTADSDPAEFVGEGPVADTDAA